MKIAKSEQLHFGMTGPIQDKHEILVRDRLIQILLSGKFELDRVSKLTMNFSKICKMNEFVYPVNM